jgi:3-oxoacyl-[acyl-carrier-protein] synthase II
MVCIEAIRIGMVPPTAHYSVPDPACDIDPVPNEARPASVRGPAQRLGLFETRLT